MQTSYPFWLLAIDGCDIFFNKLISAAVVKLFAILLEPKTLNNKKMLKKNLIIIHKLSYPHEIGGWSM